jgi:hypothetical protein
MTKSVILTVVDRHIVSQNKINENQDLIIASITRYTTTQWSNEKGQKDTQRSTKHY